MAQTLLKLVKQPDTDKYRSKPYQATAKNLIQQEKKQEAAAKELEKEKDLPKAKPGR